MTLQTVEYVVRARFQEPPDNPAIPEEDRIGDAMHAILAEIEGAATEQEIVSRTVDPDRPRRQKCPTSDLWGDRHFVTTRRYTLITPAGVAIVLCSAACALSWLVYALPADLDTVPRRDSQSETETAA